jgi:hypothetical protein
MDKEQTHPFHPSHSLKPVRPQICDSFRCLPNVEHDFPKQLQHQRKLSKGIDESGSTQICQKILCCCGNYLTLGPFFRQVSQLEDKGKVCSRSVSVSVQSEIQTGQEEWPISAQPPSEKVTPQGLKNQSHELPICRLPLESSHLIPTIPVQQTDPQPVVHPGDMISSSQQNSFDCVDIKVEKCDPESSRKFVPHHPSGKSQAARKKHVKSGENLNHRNERYQRNRRSRSRDRDRRGDKGRRGGSYGPSHDRRGELEGREGKRKSSDEIVSPDSQPIKTARDNGWLGLALNEFLKSSCQETGGMEESK